MDDSPAISVVIPVYNSQACLNELVKRIGVSLSEQSLSYEIVLVNDSSPDNSWDVIKSIVESNNQVVGICLRKNFGQDCAIMAGLRSSRGDKVVIMDDDLQHDPVFIPALYREMCKGFDVVYGKYIHKRQKWWKNVGSSFNGWVATFVINKPKEIYLSPFKIISRQTVDAIVDYNGPFPYIDGMLFRVTKHFSQVMVDHKDRFAGKGGFTLLRSLLVWSNLLTNFSVFPLRIATMLGLGSAGCGIAYGLAILIRTIIHPAAVMGWASMIVTILILGGVQLFSIGMMGEYVGKLYLNINRQPQYVIKEVVKGKA